MLRNKQCVVDIPSQIRAMLHKKQFNQLRTKAEQEVLAVIAPLGRLGHFEEAADFFSSSCVTISLPSGAIRANTSCSAVVLLDLTFSYCYCRKQLRIHK